MGKSITDLFRSETEFDVKASEMYGLMKEAAKAEFLLNAVKCDVPHTYARQIATGEKEDAPFIMAGIDLSPVKDWTPGQQVDNRTGNERAKRSNKRTCEIIGSRTGCQVGIRIRRYYQEARTARRMDRHSGHYQERKRARITSARNGNQFHIKERGSGVGRRGGRGSLRKRGLCVLVPPDHRAALYEQGRHERRAFP